MNESEDAYTEYEETMVAVTELLGDVESPSQPGAGVSTQPATGD